MAKPSAADVKKAAAAVDLDGFDDESLAVVKKIGDMRTLPGDKPAERVTITRATVKKIPKK